MATTRIATLASLLLVTSVVIACEPGVPEFTCRALPEKCGPVETPCPELPLGSGGCEALPAGRDEPAPPVSVGRPEGCFVKLPYDIENIGVTTRDCYCGRFGYEEPLSWQCPVAL